MEGLARSEQSARSAVENAHEAFICMDAGGFITDWNPQAEVTFGWSRQEAVGRVLAETIIPERFRDDHWHGLKRFVETGEAHILDTRLELSAMHREGYEFPVELTISASGDPSTRFYAFLHDISERRRSDQFLRAQHALTATLAEAESVDERAAGGHRLARPGDGMGARRLLGARRRTAALQADLERRRQRGRAVRRRSAGARCSALARGCPARPGSRGAACGWPTSPWTRASCGPTPPAARACTRRWRCRWRPADGMRGVLEFFSLEAKPRQAELVEMMSVLSAQAGTSSTCSRSARG